MALLETYGDEIGALATSHPVIAGRICQSAATREDLSAFMDRIEDFRATAGPETVGKLLDDFSASSTLMRGLVKDPGLVEGWDFVRNATSNGSAKRLSIDILEIAVKHTNDYEYLRLIGEGNMNVGRTLFGELIRNYVGKCQACVGGNVNVILPNDPKEFFDMVALLTKRYSDKNGIDIFKEAKKSYYSQEGVWHAMQHIDKLDPDIVVKLDAKFEGEGMPCSDCRFDVELTPTTENKLLFIEYKSYQNASLIPLKQFKNYIAAVSSFDEFNYIFSSAKLSLEEAKRGIKMLIKGNAEELWDINEVLFSDLNKVSGDGKLEDWEDLVELLNDPSLSLDHSIFNFVKIDR